MRHTKNIDFHYNDLKFCRHKAFCSKTLEYSTHKLYGLHTFVVLLCLFLSLTDMAAVAVKELHEAFLSMEQNNNIQIWYNMRVIVNKDRIIIIFMLHFNFSFTFPVSREYVPIVFVLNRMHINKVYVMEFLCSYPK